MIARLEDETETWRPQAVAASKLSAQRGRTKVIDVDLEGAEAEAGDECQPARGTQLLLDISSGHTCLHAVIRVARDGGKDGIRVARRIVDRHALCAAGEARRGAEVARLLAADLEPDE